MYHCIYGCIYSYVLCRQSSNDKTSEGVEDGVKIKTMLKNYFIIAVRTLWKNKLFSFVNILGLSLSMAVGVLLFSRVKADYDTDHFHPQLNRLYRILTKETFNGKESKWATAPMPLANKLDASSFVEKTVRMRFAGKYNLQTDNGDIPVDISFSEPSFFDVFGFKLLTGNANSLSNNPSAIFLSEKTAKKIFGNTSAQGQTIQFEKLGIFTVAGIIKHPSLQTHLQIEAMCSLATAETFKKNGTINNLSQNWNDFKNAAIYTRLKPGNNSTQFNLALQSNIQKTGKGTLEFVAQPLEDITPARESIQNDNSRGITTTGALILGFLIITITLLSAFNYIGLSLVKALSRAKEVGIRKTIGAARSQIFIQFLTKAVLIALLALFFTIPFVYLMIDKIPQIRFEFHVDAILLSVLLAYALLTGLIAGALPARLLSAFQPVQVLRKMKNIKLLRKVSIYKSLIVVQFSVTIMLMVFFVILTDFERKQEAAINTILPMHVLTLDLKGEDCKNIQNEIKQLSQVETVLATNWYYDAFKIANCLTKSGDKIQKMAYVSIDPKTIGAEEVKLKAGKNFPEDMPESIEQFVLINESAALLLGAKTENIIGKNILLDDANVQVIGIMPHQIVGVQIPIIYRNLPKQITTLIIKTKPNSEVAVTKACKAIWKKYFPQKPAAIHNLKERYTGEATSEVIGFFGFFSILILIIAALGILGVASYSVETRTKELGIRKILGAHKAKLIWVVSRHFINLILIAGCIGIPAGLFCSNFLRKTMGAKVDSGVINILIAFGFVLITGIVAVLSQTIRAGLVNPIKVLKTG